MFVAVVSNVYQLYLILTNRENTSCVDKYILRVASVVRCVAAQYRVHIMTQIIQRYFIITFTYFNIFEELSYRILYMMLYS